MCVCACVHISSLGRGRTGGVGVGGNEDADASLCPKDREGKPLPSALQDSPSDTARTITYRLQVKAVRVKVNENLMEDDVIIEFEK